MSENVIRRLEIERELLMNMRRKGRLDVREDSDLRRYTVTLYNVTTYVKMPDDYPALSDGPHKFAIQVPFGYPRDEPPVISFQSYPPNHPNVYKNGNICLGAWSPRETLKSLVYRVIRLILLDPSTFNFSSAADSDASAFVQTCASLPTVTLGDLFGESL